ncbi:Chmp1b [Columba guinea]|nr:Chmp1b [Columba guinea]
MRSGRSVLEIRDSFERFDREHNSPEIFVFRVTWRETKHAQRGIYYRAAEHLFNLKFAAKELNRNSKKCDKEEKAEKAKIKKAIQKGNMEVARIHAENAIRQKNQAINFLRMSARVDAVAARVQTAVTMGKISALMDRFEHQFETLDVQTQQMEDTMSNTTTLTTPQNQVDMLLQEMADEAGLDLNMELPQGQTGSVGTSVASAEQAIPGHSQTIGGDGQQFWDLQV